MAQSGVHLPALESRSMGSSCSDLTTFLSSVSAVADFCLSVHFYVICGLLSCVHLSAWSFHIMCLVYGSNVFQLLEGI